jgi:thymidylate kinase
MSNGVVTIAIEGCNAAGKSYSINIIKQYLERRGLRVMVAKAPDYKGLHGNVITQFLQGQTLSGSILYTEHSASQ